MLTEQVSLVIFTCEGREHLLEKTYNSFLAACNHQFSQVILAIDGAVNANIISYVNPDLVIYNYKRKGYVNNIKNTLTNISSPYFFWLEDDWKFNEKIDVPPLLDLLKKNANWAEILFSRFGPLSDDFKTCPLSGNLYQTSFGFSANPCICNSMHLISAFTLLTEAPKGDKLGEDGFENFLSKTFEQNGVICVIQDPVDHLPISHEGYLESTPRNWHMTNSLDEKTKAHLLTIPAPSVLRKLLMIFKLIKAFFKLCVSQFVNHRIYELCFRIIAMSKTIKKDE